MSRQRIQPSIEFGSYVTCNHCHGKGLVASKETLGVRFLRKLQIETLKPDIKNITCMLPVDVASKISHVCCRLMWPIMSSTTNVRKYSIWKHAGNFQYVLSEIARCTPARASSKTDL